MKINFKKILLSLLLVILIGVGYVVYQVNSRLSPSPNIDDSPTTFIGFNHIGITVQDLDKMLAFYQKATNFKLLKRTSVSANAAVDLLFGETGIQYEKAILKGPNMLLELTEFANQTDTIISKMPPQGPGMTHTCYQSSVSDSGFEKFKKAGASIITRGGQPIDLGGRGTTYYAYAHDPEGNMMELELMADILVKFKIGTDWAKQNPIWLTQVALISPDLPRLTAFYQKVLAIEAYRIGEYKDNPGFDVIADLDNLAFDGAWFGMDTQGKKLELMQYVNPATPDNLSKRKLTDLGYSFSFEVSDIQKEYSRLKNLGVDFASEPQKLDELWMVFAHDIDGNIFSLRQAIEKESIYSLKNF